MRMIWDAFLGFSKMMGAIFSVIYIVMSFPLFTVLAIVDDNMKLFYFLTPGMFVWCALFFREMAKIGRGE